MLTAVRVMMRGRPCTIQRFRARRASRAAATEEKWGRERGGNRNVALFSFFLTGTSSLRAGRLWDFDRSQAEKAHTIQRGFKITGRMEEDAGWPLTLVKQLVVEGRVPFPKQMKVPLHKTPPSSLGESPGGGPQVSRTRGGTWGCELLF